MEFKDMRKEIHWLWKTEPDEKNTGKDLPIREDSSLILRRKEKEKQ